MAAGGDHTACVTEDGTLYTMGSGWDGKLGHGDESNKTVPTEVQALLGVPVGKITSLSAAPLDEKREAVKEGVIMKETKETKQHNCRNCLNWYTQQLGCGIQ